MPRCAHLGVVPVVLVVGPRERHNARRNEAAEVVHVACRVWGHCIAGSTSADRAEQHGRNGSRRRREQCRRQQQTHTRLALSDQCYHDMTHCASSEQAGRRGYECHPPLTTESSPATPFHSQMIFSRPRYSCWEGKERIVHTKGG